MAGKYGLEAGMGGWGKAVKKQLVKRAAKVRSAKNRAARLRRQAY